LDQGEIQRGDGLRDRGRCRSELYADWRAYQAPDRGYPCTMRKEYLRQDGTAGGRRDGDSLGVTFNTI